MQELSFETMLVRIAVALGMGLMLGFERESHGRAAGIRTTMLVCVASAIAMLLSEYLFKAVTPGSAWRPDPARLAQGVLAGMGFLGAGVILKHRQMVQGVTTAAVLWFAAILGMAAGAGYQALAGVGFAVALGALFVIPKLEGLVQSDRYALVTVETGLQGPKHEQLHQVLVAAGPALHVKLISMEMDRPRKKSSYVFEVKVKKDQLEKIQANSVEALLGLKGVSKSTWA